jgi:hypothetical protein
MDVDVGLRKTFGSMACRCLGNKLGNRAMVENNYKGKVAPRLSGERPFEADSTPSGLKGLYFV